MVSSQVYKVTNRELDESVDAYIKEQEVIPEIRYIELPLDNIRSFIDEGIHCSRFNRFNAAAGASGPQGTGLQAGAGAAADADDGDSGPAPPLCPPTSAWSPMADSGVVASRFADLATRSQPVQGTTYYIAQSVVNNSNLLPDHPCICVAGGLRNVVNQSMSSCIR
jgi:hypothetical protein